MQVKLGVGGAKRSAPVRQEGVELESTGKRGAGAVRGTTLGENPTFHREHRGMWILIHGCSEENKGENHLAATRKLHSGDAGRPEPREDKAFGSYS